MPSLPRIRRTRPRSFAEAVVPRPEPRVAEVTAEGLTWLHVDTLDPEVVNDLRQRFGWHPLDVEDVLSKRQRPKIDDYAEEGYLFAVLHFPVFDKSAGRLNAGELDVFIGPDYLVTLPNVELAPVSRLFRRCEADDVLRRQLFSKGSGRLLYEVLDDLFDYCFPILDKIAHKLDTLEDELFEGRAEEIVRDISNVKQEIISYRKIIKPERSTLRLRVLTVFSVVLLPLTVITGLFGMNVAFPGEGTGHAFWVVVTVMAVLLVGLLGFFRWQ